LLKIGLTLKFCLTIPVIHHLAHRPNLCVVDANLCVVDATLCYRANLSSTMIAATALANLATKHFAILWADHD